MAKKLGTCMNLDCDNYKKEVEVEPGEEFECPVCHQLLKEGKGRNNKNGNPGKKKTMMIVGGLVIVAAAAAGIVLSMGDGKSKTPAKESPVVVSLPVETSKADTPAVAVTPEPEVVDEPTKETAKPKANAPQVQNGKGTVNLGYGTYTGDLKNGKPHGYGKITYKTSRKIVSSKDFVANPGDTFEGEFRDGKISGLGYWKHDGNETAVKP